MLEQMAMCALRVAKDGDVGSFNIYATTFTSVSHQIRYSVCPLHDSNIPMKEEAAYSITIQLCDPAGNNMSSPPTVVHALRVTQTSSNTPIELYDTRNANPDFDFRYDSSLIGYGLLRDRNEQTELHRRRGSEYAHRQDLP